jgi:ligand-binding SRPBCC domain-containing protein
MPTFVKSVLVNAPVERVFGFHERADAFALLSPPFPPVRIVSKVGTGVQVGVRVEIRVGPTRWLALHTGYEKNKLFVDEQVKGPFAKWVHRHEFEAVDGKTRLTDRVQFELPGGGVVNALFGWAAKLALVDMFRHRHEVTCRICEGRIGEGK